MHDPLTQAFVINIPLPWRRPAFGGLSPGREWAKYHLATIWHKDPCQGPGGDDSCGWFMRAHHGDKAVLKRIRDAIEFNFDRVFEYRKDDWDDSKKKAGTPPDSIHFMGYFHPCGDPNYSTHGIVLNLFFDAIHAYYNHNWKKSLPWMRKHLFDILHFAENPTDSLREGIAGTFCSGKEKYDREARIDSYASCIYGWILRAEQPWWKHPRWHVRHWRLQVPLWQIFRRWAFERCSKCGRGFGWGETVMSDWNGTHIWHDDCSAPTKTRLANQAPKKA